MTLPKFDETIRSNAIIALYKRFPTKTLHEYVMKRYSDVTTAAAAMGVARATIVSWGYSDDMMTTFHADRLACRLGVHPCVIWPQWFDIDPDQEEKVCRKREQNRKRQEARKAKLLQSAT